MTRQEGDGSDPLQKNIDRAIGFAALRRLSKLAQEEVAQEKANLVWTKRFSLAFGAIFAVTLVIALTDPDVLRNLFRSIAGVIR